MKTFKEISEGKFVDTHLKNGRPNKDHPSYATHKATYDQFKKTPKKKIDESYDKHAAAASQHDKDYARTGDPEAMQDAVKAHTRAMNTAPNDKMVQVHRNKLDDHLQLKEPKKIKESETNMKFSNYLEELSKGTLGSYIKKSKHDMANYSDASNRQNKISSDHISKSYSEEDPAKAAEHGKLAYDYKKKSQQSAHFERNRNKGMNGAVDRLTKESVTEDRDSEFSANDHMASTPKLTVRLKNKKTNATVGKFDSHDAAKAAHAKHPERKNIYIESVEILEDKQLDESHSIHQHQTSKTSSKWGTGGLEFAKKEAIASTKHFAKHGHEFSVRDADDKIIHHYAHKERPHNGGSYVWDKTTGKTVSESTEQLDESPFDWKAGKRELTWDDKEKKADGDNSGVHSARTKARNPEGGAMKKNRVGRPDGKYDKDYKISRDKREDPNYKKELSKKVMAAKADNFKDREYFKNTMNTGIGHHQLKHAGLPASDIKHLKPMVKLPGNK